MCFVFPLKGILKIMFNSGPYKLKNLYIFNSLEGLLVAPLALMCPYSTTSMQDIQDMSPTELAKQHIHRLTTRLSEISGWSEKSKTNWNKIRNTITSLIHFNKKVGTQICFHITMLRPYYGTFCYKFLHTLSLSSTSF